MGTESPNFAHCVVCRKRERATIFLIIMVDGIPHRVHPTCKLEPKHHHVKR